MRAVQVQFGGGFLPPKLSAHLRAPKAKSESPTPKTEFGGGWVAPKVKAHLVKKFKAQSSPKSQFGGGLVTPKLVNHLRRVSTPAK